MLYIVCAEGDLMICRYTYCIYCLSNTSIHFQSTFFVVASVHDRKLNLNGHGSSRAEAICEAGACCHLSGVSSGFLMF